ncbi:DUF2637 domain-containing protein [Streptomyces sp. BRA346]|uniref:DUF2637 domain-containing protein n=1 Tax=Streptomyces sp. BRA346 TaxID=2878199 RepID=UPI00406369F1
MPELTRVHRLLIGVVVVGAVVIASIGFAGSYSAVRDLAEEKGFGAFANAFPIGIDAGICVLLALDLLLTWIRIPFPLLRQTAWMLTVATIAFNGAAAWPDPIGVGMHAVIPVLFVVSVEAARHAVGRIADITADRHMEGVRVTRWLLSPLPTFKLWRRMKLWEIRSYEVAVEREQDRMVYQARLQARYGRQWRRKAPVEALMPLRLARYGVPLAETAPAGLEAAGITEPLPLERVDVRRELEAGEETAVPLVDVDSTEAYAMEESVDEPVEQHQGDEAAAAEHPVAPWTPEMGQGEIQYQDLVNHLREHGRFPNRDQLLAAQSQPVAARGEGRSAVQARVDHFEHAVDEADLSPIGDTGPVPAEQLVESRDVPLPQPPAETADEEPGLEGVELLEHHFLQLPAEEQARSASALAKVLHEGAGFTEGTARKYLGLIKKKHAQA